MFLRRHEGASVSDVAQHLEIALPSVSRLADGLVARGLVRRQHDAGDRRRVTLALTVAGRDTLQAAQQAAHEYLIEALTRLSPSTRAVVAQAMRALQGAFAPGREPESVGTR
jgi:DNA-binding MarR family transcriptional regulator